MKNVENQPRTLRNIGLAGAAALMLSGIPAAVPAGAAPPKVRSMVTGILDKASDGALDRLSQPGAFYADTAVRIILPGAAGGVASKLLDMGGKLGLTDDLTRTINDAAGSAAAEAKPIFRSAIDNLKITDAPGLIATRDGGTRYLKRSAGPTLRSKIRPLMVAALDRLGAFRMLDGLGGTAASLGLTRDKLSDSVTDQALNGIYSYMGSEEAKLRANPLGAGKSLIDGILRH